MAKEDNTRKQPMEYMRMAVEVMKQSIHERKKENPSPYVGAVLVFPDGSISTAYRGEYRDGDHAEYTVLDKKNRDKDLTGCWLFATLEPCAPGARNAPKVSCAERIVNARIVEVWFGIEDKNPTVDHAGIEYLEANGVKVHQFLPEFHKEIEEANKEFMKWASMKNQEIKVLKKEKGRLDMRAVETNMESLSEAALEKFINESGRDYQPTSMAFLQELKEMGLLEYDKEAKTFMPTGNAILLFGKRPRNSFPQAGVKAKIQYPDGTTGAETIDEALVLLPDKIEGWLRKVLPMSIDRTKFKARQVPSFPVEVVREAVINAIVHRDYSVEGASIHIEVYANRIVVKSPGAPIPPITIEAMKTFTATSYSRNKKLSFIFNEMGYMEELGLGMDTFKSIKEKFQLPLPLIAFDGLNTVITFPRTIEAVKQVGGKALSELTEAQILGYEWLKSVGEASTREYSSKLNIGYKTAQRHLAKMKDLGLITDNGQDINSPNYRYVVLESN